MEIEKLIEILRGKCAVCKRSSCNGKYWQLSSCPATCEAATALEQLQAENDRLKRERDAAVEEIPKVCYYCKHRKGWKTCDRFDGNSEAETCTKWQWRGPKEE